MALLAFQLDCERGTIASSSTVTLRSTVRPHRRARYLWTVSYQTLNASGREKHKHYQQANVCSCILFHHLIRLILHRCVSPPGFLSSPPQVLCEVRAKAVFPTLKVIDASGGGSVGRLSKVHLWKLLSLDSLNEHLLCNPSPAELTYRTPSKHRLNA